MALRRIGLRHSVRSPQGCLGMEVALCLFSSLVEFGKKLHSCSGMTFFFLHPLVSSFLENMVLIASSYVLLDPAM